MEYSGKIINKNIKNNFRFLSAGGNYEIAEIDYQRITAF